MSTRIDEALSEIVDIPGKKNDGFHSLVQALSRYLGPSSGLDSADIDPRYLENLMEAYVSQEDEWINYALGDPSRAYTRNLIDRGNGKSNLLILVWTPGKSSPIHDHADAHCVMKVLQGSLKETRYEWPDHEKTENGIDSPLHVKKETVFKQNQVTYMSDGLGLHKISNPDHGKMAVSLHLYTPPNAARDGCHMFDEKTGKASHVWQSSYYSELGQKL